jgi:hypothetical protein
MESDLKFKFWIDNNLNVLLMGKAGTGKTSMVKSAFDAAGLKWKYFSASTMDPWVDFIGIPKEKTVNGVSVLDLVRPIEFAFDDVEAIFMDEYNRAHKKVRNAVMELIQFKSINGKEFKNLRMVWAAINPDDDSDQVYDVEKLDPAQKDRFHVQMTVPYKPSKKYFISKYGSNIATAAVEWWNELPDKNLVTPRRLDYALEVLQKDGDARDILDSKTNVSKLIETIQNGPFKERMDTIANTKSMEACAAFINKPNNFASAQKFFETSDATSALFAQCLSDENIMALFAKNKKTIKVFHDNMKLMDTTQASAFKRKIQGLSNYCRNIEVKKQIDGLFAPDVAELGKTFADSNCLLAPQSQKDLHDMLDAMISMATSTTSNTAQRENVFVRVNNFVMARGNTLDKEDIGTINRLYHVVIATMFRTQVGTIKNRFNGMGNCFTSLVKAMQTNTGLTYPSVVPKDLRGMTSYCMNTKGFASNKDFKLV